MADKSEEVRRLLSEAKSTAYEIETDRGDLEEIRIECRIFPLGISALVHSP